MGERGFLGSRAWPPAEEDTQVYLEILGAAADKLSLRGTFLVGSFLGMLREVEGPPVTEAWESRTGVVSLSGGRGSDRGCLGTDPQVTWLLTQVNLDRLKGEEAV